MFRIAIRSYSTATTSHNLTLLPYKIKRTPSLQLPVYSEIKNGGDRVWTIIRKVEGNLDALKSELDQVFPGVQSHVKPQARQIVLHADVVKEVKEWLGQERGF